MKELDLLLENYLTRDFSNAPPPEQRAFADLLNLPDPVLLSYITDQAQPETEDQRRVIARLRRTSRT